MKLRITVDGTVYDVEVEVLEHGQEHRLPAAAPGMPVPSAAPAAMTPVAEAASPPTASDGDAGTVRSPFTGPVQQVLVKPGDHVEANQHLLVLEAMKVESYIAAPTRGTVREVCVSIGQTVRTGDVVVRLD